MISKSALKVKIEFYVVEKPVVNSKTENLNHLNKMPYIMGPFLSSFVAFSQTYNTFYNMEY